MVAPVAYFNDFSEGVVRLVAKGDCIYDCFPDTFHGSGTDLKNERNYCKKALNRDSFYARIFHILQHSIG